MSGKYSAEDIAEQYRKRRAAGGDGAAPAPPSPAATGMTAHLGERPSADEVRARLEALRAARASQAQAVQPAPVQPAPTSAPVRPQVTRMVDVIDATAPLKRVWLDAATPVMRLFLAAILVGFSSLSTVKYAGEQIGYATVVNGVQMTVLLAGQAIELRYILSVGVALIIFGLELFLAERAKIWYGLVLAVDAYYTNRQLQPWVDAIMAAGRPAEEMKQWQQGVSLLIGWVSSGAIAHFGEILLLGKRRKTVRTAVAAPAT